MPHERMARNLNQSIFAILVGTIFSWLIVALFSMNALILAIFEIPLAILVELYVVTECVYSYKDEVSIQTTFNMLGSLLKSLLISIPIVIFYSAIILILHNSIGSLNRALEPLFLGTIQGLEVFLAIPLLNFIPVFIMIFATPFLLFFYGKIHILIWGGSKREKSEVRAELEVKDKEIHEQKTSEIMKVLDDSMVQLQQYLLELQAFDVTINSINDHGSYKTVTMRLTMMNDYIVSLGIEETKENKSFLIEKEISNKIKEIDMQKVTITDIIEQKAKKLKKEKGIFEKDEQPDDYIKGKPKRKRKELPEPPEEEKKKLPEPPEEEKKKLPEPPEEEKKKLPEPPEEEKKKLPEPPEEKNDEKNEESEE
ncbi:MAG: hypothetical protein ACTSYH_07020 [Candidatus Heimdallarchaeaceae archaeon]